MDAEAVSIPLADGRMVSGLLSLPSDAAAGLVLAHGARAGMTHKAMTALADGLLARGVASLRFQFPYMENGSRRPDRPEVAQATVRTAVDVAGRLMPGLPLFAGGRSFGGRMTSQAQAAAPLPTVRGLVFFAYPLHPAGKPSDARAAHLAAVRIPMLFLQGTRDALAETTLLAPVMERLRPRATLHAIEDADHSFHVPARSGRTDAEVLAEALDTVAAWMRQISTDP